MNCITGFRDLDFVVMLYVSDENLRNIFLVNKAIQNIGNSDEFWRLRTQTQRSVKRLLCKPDRLSWRGWYCKPLDVLVVVMAKDCPHSQHRNMWNDMKSQLSKFVHKIIDIDVPMIGCPTPSTDLERFVWWYPAFILVSKKSFQEAKELSASVFSGRFDVLKNRIEFDVSNMKDYTICNLLNWIIQISFS